MDILKQISLQEKGDAEVFAEIFKDKLIFDHTEGQWYKFNGHVWKTDNDKSVYNLVESVALLYEAEVNQMQLPPSDGVYRFYRARINHLRKRTGIKSALELATAKMPLTETWDDNPYLLAVKNGVVDLKTGELRAGKPDDYIRKYANVEWKGLEEPCHRWVQFFNELFPRNPEIIEFLQCLFGYALSGLSVEHVMPIFFGEQGRNGKDVLLTTLCAVMGEDLAGPVSKEVLLSGLKNPGASAPFLYELQGKRLVYADETSEGAGFDEAQVKMLSGGAPFIAKKLYHQPTVIYPQYLLVLTSNSRPNVDCNDEAIWERLILVEFTERFVTEPTYDNEHPQDKFLKYKLEDEYSGILAWLVQGFLRWQKDGLQIPDSVKFTTKTYREDQDSLGRFLDAECIIESTERIQATALLRQYEQWAATDGTRRLNSREFSRKLEAKGFTKRRYNDGIYYLGLKLKPSFEQEVESYLEMIQTK